MGNSKQGDLAGVIPIPVTTFTADGALDTGGLRSQVDFCLAANVHGLLYPGVVSEFYTLTDEERRVAVETFVEAVGGRVPTVVAVSAQSTVAAVMLTRQAAALQVDAVMTMTPYVQHFFTPDASFAQAHVGAVADAAERPLILQNARIGFPVAVPVLAALVDAVPAVRYVKQETNPPTQGISAVIDALAGKVEGVFGGVGGIYLTNELDRGAAGSMPSPAFADRIVTAFDAYRTRGPHACQLVLDPLGSLFTRELLYNVAFIKHVLVRRGVIGSAKVRIASPRLDEADRSDLDRMLNAAGLI